MDWLTGEVTALLMTLIVSTAGSVVAVVIGKGRKDFTDDVKDFSEAMKDIRDWTISMGDHIQNAAESRQDILYIRAKIDTDHENIKRIAMGVHDLISFPYEFKKITNEIKAIILEKLSSIGAQGQKN